MVISRHTAFEYILFSLDNYKYLFNNPGQVYDQLNPIFLQRDIYIDRTFTNNLIRLSLLYEKVRQMYTPDRFNLFVNATQESILNNKIQKLEEFPPPIKDFYNLLSLLTYTLTLPRYSSSRDGTNIRFNTIIDNLNIVNIIQEIVWKYDRPFSLSYIKTISLKGTPHASIFSPPEDILLQEGKTKKYLI